MNTLLIFFAIPVATIIFSIVLQKLLQSPILVSATFFAIFLIITFAVFDESFLVFAILYTLLALLTALVVRFICCLINNSSNPCINGNAMHNNGICGNNTTDENAENDTNSCGCGCNSNRSYVSNMTNVQNQFLGRRYKMRR